MDDTTALDAGIASADGPEKSREHADVKRWFERIDSARKFDEAARVQYAKDRRYARGDSGFEVDANLVGTYIDIQEAFLYAQDPNFDVTPGPMIRPPSAEAIRDAVEDTIRQDPRMLQAGAQGAAAAVAMGTPPDLAMQVGMQTQEAAIEAEIQAQVKQIRQRYARRNREIKAFAETCEVIGTRMWQDAQLRRRGRPWVRSGLTVGVGILKASWQERTEQSPETRQAINDLQANLQKSQALRRAIEDGDAGVLERLANGVSSWFGNDVDAKIAEYERQVAALQGQAERVVARGYVADVVAGEDFQVAPGYTIANHLDAPWNAHRIFIHCDDAASQFGAYLSRNGGKPDEYLKKATRYTARKPVMIKGKSAMVDEPSAEEADSFKKGADDAEGGHFLCLWEIWDRDSNTVLTGIEGLDCWVKPEWTPPATTRFYPFFLFTTSEVDGQRHPQSLVTRSMKLVDEYNRIGSAEAEHRRRIRPKTAFNSGILDPENAEKLAQATSNEMVPLKLTRPDVPVGNVIQPIAYAALDPALYDRSRIIQELERIWSIQEALGGSISTAKTATEAEIQQTGFQARTGGKRDAAELALSDLAQYTVEVARVYLTAEDVREIAGPDAMWPEYGGPDDLRRMVNVSIRAGSSGKPNTSADRQAWSTMLPLLQNGITQIGQLRGATPAAIADSLEQLLRITAEKAGDRIDIDQLIPQGDGAMPMLPAPSGAQPVSASPGAAPVMPANDEAIPA